MRFTVLLKKKVTKIVFSTIVVLLYGLPLQAQEQYKAAETQLWQKKSQLALKHLASNNIFPQSGDRGKYVMPALIASGWQSTQDPQASPEINWTAQQLQQLKSLTAKEAKDFYTNSDAFKAPGITRLLYLFPQDAQLQQAQQDYFQYLFPEQEAKQKYNFWRSGGTENFVNMLRTSGYLLAQKAVEQDLPKARQKLKGKETWLQNKASKTYAKGAAEWDSSSYTIFNVIGWLNVYDFAQDPAMQARAKAVLDYYAAVMALKYSDGVYGGAEQRGGSATQPYQSHTDFLGWLWFSEYVPSELDLDDFFDWPQYIQLVHPATSSYRPPLAAIELARKVNLTPSNYQNVKANYSLGKLVSPEIFSLNHTYSLGTALVTTGEQVVNWKLVSYDTSNELAKVATGGNSFSSAKSRKNGMGKTFYDRYFQDQNILVQATYVPKEAKSQLGKQQLRNFLVNTISKIPCGNTCRFFLSSQVNKVIPQVNYPLKKQDGKYQVANYLSFPEGTELIRQQERYFVQLNNTYLAISPFPPQNLELQTQGDRAYLEVQAPLDTMAGFVVEVGNQIQHQDFNNFQQLFTNSQPLDLKQLDWAKIRYKSLDNRQLLFDYGKNYNQASLRVDSKLVNLPLTHLYDGKQLKLKEKILQLTTPNHRYEVNFQQELPVFKEETK